MHRQGSPPLMHTLSFDSIESPPKSSMPCPPPRDIAAGQHVLRLRHTSSKVWSDIRGAIKAIGRSSNGNPTVAKWTPRGTTPEPCHGKIIAVNNERVFPSTPQVKGITPKDILRKLRLKHPALASNTTVVLRTPPLRGRSSLQALTNVHFPSSSELGSSHSSNETSKMSTAADESTRKTSVDSRFSCSTKPTANRRHSRRNPWTRSSPEGGALNTIQESGISFAQPTVETVERAAAAKIYLETKFNELLHKPNTRGVRRQYLESQLYYSPHLTLEQKQAIYESFNNQETWHLREIRVMKSQSLAVGREESACPYLDHYEPLQVLGKGSFGVVRLVREKHATGHTFSRQVYAMKVIRKSEMLRSCQEGHLRAERDFLVASEGSNWWVFLIILAKI
ncbi:Serine/threonine-protein kinase cbk1 [Ilyonectria robusta]